MPPTDAFLPRIISVFYAIFHEKHGHQIVYQVPEGLIASGSSPQAAPPSPAFSDAALPSQPRSSAASPERAGSLRSSPRKPHHITTTGVTLFDFPSISTYVLPPAELCGRLLTIRVKQCAVMGFPVRVDGPAQYKRTYFQYNVCFVFDGSQSAELAPYEPVVRKIGRVLANCEQESSFLSNASTSRHMHSILEQLYQDLNSYSEASVHIDAFNSLELKVFPFFPNPRPVYDWSVPVPLLEFSKLHTEDWDLTVQRMYRYIDGVNHCAKIARLSQCDTSLVRDAVAHLLFYQTVLLIDIFQYSNIYALRRPLSWLATSKWVITECGPYVSKATDKYPDWPSLLEMYSHFGGGVSVSSWIDRIGDNDLEKVDVRRFVSFGVIKGFLRRLHRYPYFIKRHDGDVTDTEGGAMQTPMNPFARTPLPPTGYGLPLDSSASSPVAATAVVPSYAVASTRRKNSTATDPGLTRGRALVSDVGPGRRASLVARGPPASVLAQPTHHHLGHQRRQHDRSHSNSQAHETSSPVSPPDGAGGGSASSGYIGLGAGRSGTTAEHDDHPLKPEEFESCLDGTRHCDELCIRFGVNWSTLERWCDAAEGGKVHIVCK